MPELNPFERVFNPPGPGQEPSIFGAIGGLFGNQSNEERAGAANADAIQALSKMVNEDKLSPQQALTQFLATPQGHDVLARGGIKDLGMQFRQALEQTQTVTSIPPGNTPVVNQPGVPAKVAAEPTMTAEQATARTIAPTIGAAPGQTILQQPQGQYGYKPAFNQPTTAVQDFKGFTGIANLPSEVVGEMARLQALPADQRDGEVTRVFAQAVKNGSVTQEVADKLRLDYYKEAVTVAPLLNRVGEPIGNTIIDKSNPSAPRTYFIPNSVGGQPGNPTPPGAPQAPAGSPAAMTQPAQSGQPASPGSDKRLMFFGSGMAPWLLNTYGQVVRNIGLGIPTAGSEEANANIRNLNFLQNSVVQLSRAGEGLNIPNKVIAMAQNMAPGSSLWEDPKTAVAHAIDLHANLTQELRGDEAKLNSPQVSKEQKHAAEKRISAYEGVLQNLPSMTEMTALKRDIDANGPITQQNVVTPGSLAKSAVQGAKGAMGEGKKQAQDFSYPAGTKSGDVQAGSKNRFEALGDDALLGVQVDKLSAKQQQQYLEAVRSRRQRMKQ